MIIMTLGVIAAVVAPYLLWRWYVSNTEQVFDGPARVVNRGLLGNDAVEKEFDYLSVDVPGWGHPLLRVAKSRVRTLTGFQTLVNVTLKKKPFGKPYIATITWPGETVAESVDVDNSGLYFGGIYLLLGLASLAFLLPHATTALWQHVALYGSMAILALGGYIFSAKENKDLGDISTSQSKFLFIPLGRGVTGLAIMTALVVVINAAIFWTPGIWLLLGLNTAFAMGGCFAILQRALQRQAQ